MQRFRTYCLFLWEQQNEAAYFPKCVCRRNSIAAVVIAVRAWRWVRYGEFPLSPDNIDFHSTWGVLVELSIAKTKGCTPQSALKNTHTYQPPRFSAWPPLFFFFKEYNTPARKGARHSPWPLNGLLLCFLLPLEKKGRRKCDRVYNRPVVLRRLSRSEGDRGRRSALHIKKEKKTENEDRLPPDLTLLMCPPVSHQWQLAH